jgi:prepilin-type N-terminal cleavage/methylation domain-containing protein
MRTVRGKERGFTLIELLTVVAIIGILVNIAVPVLRAQIKRAQAVRVVQDFLTVRQAAMQYYADNGTMPRDRRPGREPRELKPYLEHRILWKNPIPGTDYDWENWVRKNGKPKHPWTGVLYGFSVTTRDMDLVHAIEKVYDGPFHYTLGRNYTFVIIPTQGTTGRHRRRR